MNQLERQGEQKGDTKETFLAIANKEPKIKFLVYRLAKDKPIPSKPKKEYLVDTYEEAVDKKEELLETDPGRIYEIVPKVEDQRFKNGGWRPNANGAPKRPKEVKNVKAYNVNVYEHLLDRLPGEGFSDKFRNAVEAIKDLETISLDADDVTYFFMEGSRAKRNLKWYSKFYTQEAINKFLERFSEQIKNAYAEAGYSWSPNAQQITNVLISVYLKEVG